MKINGNIRICLDEMKAATCAQQNSCQNGATCVDNVLNTHTCICTPQWTGDLCDYPIGIVILFSLKKMVFKLILRSRDECLFNESMS